MSVVYAQEQSLSAEDYVSVLAGTTMEHKRPLPNLARIDRMLRGANLIVTARENGTILGLARCLSDGAWIAYCAELTVKAEAQGRGIGAGILAKVRDIIGPGVSLLLISEPEAVGFYERVGMVPMPRAYVHARTDRS